MICIVILFGYGGSYAQLSYLLRPFLIDLCSFRSISHGPVAAACSLSAGLNRNAERDETGEIGHHVRGELR
jgi:hypothetical protein